ncbi:rho GTPase-activating protein 100F isoform X2 [Agrilus planipennis]|uniref:Rho GTPase-activating protein 100F isoform X2 n=1 Tax=Agrilus planipennis TaxID=224129 RepID=A0A1W4WQX2_AGRPL|nr:rho GTPase-activating protein 100F isoform X2 [Agrilus planipennis]
MQWRKLARYKISSGRSRTRSMLCCGRRTKENVREALDLTASPLRGQPQNSRANHPPMVIQGDFRKVSGISSEIFKQIETVENDHDASTAAALEAVERRGEMIVRILDSRQLGRAAGEAAKRFLAMQDAKHTVQFVEIVKRPGQTLGLYIREGNGIDRNDGVFISRIALESAVYNSGCLKVGDEILAVNLVDVTRMSLDDVVIIMSIPRRLVLATRQRKGSKGGQGSPSVQPRSEHKQPPVVVIKRDIREEDQDDGDLSQSRDRDRDRDSSIRRHGDGRETSESRSRSLGLGISSMDSRHSQESNGLDLYYNSRPPDSSGSSWGYQPPPPVITEQPKSSMQHFQPYERTYPNTLESLAEKVHSFALPGRRMSVGTQPLSSSRLSQQSPHYYVQHPSTGSRRIMPRSGSDQHLPHTEYADYTSITPAGRHSLLRSSLKSGSTLSRYNQRYVDQTPQMSGPKYGTATMSQYGTPGTAGTLSRRTRGSLDYSSDTEATLGPRSSYYYYRNQGVIPHSTIPTLGRNNSLTAADISTKFNSLPRDSARGSTTRLSAMNKRFGDRSVSLVHDESDGTLSAPEMPSIRKDRGRIPSAGVFTSDEYRQWLSRTPSTSAIYEQIRASRDVLNQQRAARFTYSAENIHQALKNAEGSYYGAYGRPGTTSTLDRHFTRTQHPTVPARSLSTQHITSSTSALSSSRSPSMRRMRQLLDLDSGRAAAAPSPVPTPSGTLPRGQRQLDINPAEFLKYKIDKPGGVGGTGLPMSGTLPSTDEPVSGMLWVHLLAGRGLRPSTGGSTATTPVTPSGSTPSIGGSGTLRDLYCVLECDRVHKARTVVRTGDLVFDWDESFELDLVNNRELDLLVYSWDPQYRHKLCYKGSVHLPSLLKTGPLHQLALKIEPRGTLYLRLRYTDSHTVYRRKAVSSISLTRTTNPPLFGVDLETVVSRESRTGGVPGGVATGLIAGTLQVPLIVKRCVEEVERRGLDIIGLYRLCGSATKKRILREAFERNSRSVDLTPENVPDINVITGVLKDYLRELPEPLFTKCLYQMMVDALGVCLPDDPEGNAKLMFSILDCLPRINRATLIFIMDHLSLVVSASDRNKMSAQNLATALAPPLMLQSNETTTPGCRLPDLDYSQPISLLKYLLQIWPVPKHRGRRAKLAEQRGDSRSALPLGGQQMVLVRAPSRPSAAPCPPPLRSAVSEYRGPVQQVQSHQTLDPSSASKGLYRPLSPRAGPLPSVPAGLKPRQVIVSSPGSPSSSSDSQSGSDSVKHCLPHGRIGSPKVRAPPSPSSRHSPSIANGPQSSAATQLRSSPSVTLSSLRNSPSSATVSSPGPKHSPSISSLARASPSLMSASATTRSSSPAMQATSAGLNVTMATTTPSFSSSTTISSTASNIFGSTYTTQQPLTYASTNPFLTGAYMQYAPGESGSFMEKYNTISSTKDFSKPFSFSDSSYGDANKYSTLNTKNIYGTSDSLFGTSDTRYDSKNGYLSTGGYGSDKYSPSPTPSRESKTSSFDTSPNVTQSNGTVHLTVEDTPTPTSSIETEDSTTREVGEKDVEGDGEQSD